MRALVVWTVAFLALGFASGFLTGAAHGAVQPTPQQVGDQTAAWLSTTLRVPMPSRRVVVGPVYSENTAGEYQPADDTITLAADFAYLSPASLYVQLHEHLHRAETIDGCYQDEEGIVDAITRDLYPAFMRRVLPRWVTFGEPHTDYDPQVRGVRYASAAATGRSWRSREARTWRRALWGASCEGRAAMLAQAAAAVVR